jgi:hypothetical protein
MVEQRKMKALHQLECFKCRRKISSNITYYEYIYPCPPGAATPFFVIDYCVSCHIETNQQIEKT